MKNQGNSSGKREGIDTSRTNPNCYQCLFFYITWDRAFPYGCKALGFKGRRIPSLDVLTASGSRCLYFREKTTGEHPDEN
ncbi:hypothetical protein ALO_08670 [Acetonema longum DSM 6540]|uniref:Uracil-DNA glycosylase n=1 Tax=Acetonema longum DSM 6540 TaxID=1009370 RepID=F7NI36_9FIRM|nr:hypothetical protein ALO_08670 [Acetonema longum DSM 6540]